MNISDSGDGPSFNLDIVGQFNGGQFNQNENMANNDANQDEQDLDSLALRGLKRLVCIIICGMIVTGTAQTEEEQWFWAWCLFVFLAL